MSQSVCSDCKGLIESQDYVDLSMIRFRRPLCKACFVAVKEATKAEVAVVNGETRVPSVNDWLAKRQRQHKLERKKLAAVEFAAERERIATTQRFFP